MKPEWMIGMARTTRPAGVDKTVVKILLHFFNEFVAIHPCVVDVHRCVVDEALDSRHEMSHYRILPGTKGGFYIAKQSFNDTRAIGLRNCHKNG